MKQNIENEFFGKVQELGLLGVTYKCWRAQMTFRFEAVGSPQGEKQLEGFGKDWALLSNERLEGSEQVYNGFWSAVRSIGDQWIYSSIKGVFTRFSSEEVEVSWSVSHPSDRRTCDNSGPDRLDFFIMSVPLAISSVFHWLVSMRSLAQVEREQQASPGISAC